MSEPTTGVPQSAERADASVETLGGDREVALQIEGSQLGGVGGYSIIVRGEIQASSVLSTEVPDETVTLLEDETKLLSGSVGGGTVGFLLDGEVLAAEFDEPAPVVRLDGEAVDPGRWPTARAYLGGETGEDPVEDPFPDSGEMGKPRGDPLDPQEVVVVLEADGEAGAYCFDVDGEVLDHPEGASVSGKGDRVYGYLQPERSARIPIRGTVTRVDTAEGIGFSVRSAD